MPRDLMQLSDTEFNEVVNEEVRGVATQEDATLLRNKETVDRWAITLLGLKRSVETQFGAKRAEAAQREYALYERGNPSRLELTQIKTEHAEWRSKALRFLNGLEDRLAEARKLCKEYSLLTDVTILSRERENLVRQILLLREGIAKHKGTVTTSEEEDTEAADTELWSLVE